MHSSAPVAPDPRPPLPAASLAWRLALVAVMVHLLYGALLQGYSMFALPHSQQLREAYSQPGNLVPLLASMLASALLAGITVWASMHGWLRRHDTRAVDRPGKLIGTFIALQLIYALMISSGAAYLHNLGMQYIMAHQDALTEQFGLELRTQFLVLSLILRVVGVSLGIIGMIVTVRIAALTVQPQGPSGAPAYERRHAAWIAGLTVLTWQLFISMTLDGFLKLQSLGASWTPYLLGYLVVPALLLLLCVLACLKFLPRHLGRAGVGRAVAHGSFAFWLAQLAGIGLAYLVLVSMQGIALVSAGGSYLPSIVVLTVYAVLLALGCLLGRLALYPRARPVTAG